MLFAAHQTLVRVRTFMRYARLLCLVVGLCVKHISYMIGGYHKNANAHIAHRTTEMPAPKPARRRSSYSRNHEIIRHWDHGIRWRLNRPFVVVDVCVYVLNSRFICIRTIQGGFINLREMKGSTRIGMYIYNARSNDDTKCVTLPK